MHDSLRPVKDRNGLSDGCGVDLVRKMREENPDVSVPALAESKDSKRYARVLEAGVEKVLGGDARIKEVIGTTGVEAGRSF